MSAPEARPTFRIVVPTYARPDLLAQFLGDLLPQLERHPEFCLVVVNDGSHDDAYAKVVVSCSETLTYVSLPENRGSGPARQAGFEGATEDYLVTTDDDCRPPSQWLDRILALAMTYPDVDLFVGTTRAVDAARGIVARQIVDLSPSPVPILDGAKLIAATTASAVFSRQALARAGGFAPDLTTRPGEDCWLTQSLLRTGCAWRLSPELLTGHRAIRSTSKVMRRFHRYGRATARYVIRNQDWRLATMTGAPTVLGSFRRSWRYAREAWSTSVNHSFRRFARAVRCGLTLVERLAFERGWRRGVKHYARQYGQAFPRRPALVEQYSDFCSQIVLPAPKS